MLLSKDVIVKELSQLPGITINHSIEGENSYIINLSIDSSSEIKGAKMFLDYNITIIFPHSYPTNLPICYESGEKKVISYHHINPDKLGTFCLGTEMEMRYRLSPNYNIINYFQLIIEYLTIYTYFKKYHSMPVIERSHGNKGIIEGYLNLFNCSNEIPILRLLSSLPIKNKNRNLPCPCGSTKKTKNCHFYDLKKISSSRLLYTQAKKDLEILKNEVRQ